MQLLTRLAAFLPTPLRKTRWLRWLALLPVALALVYILAANLFLRLGGVQKALAGTDQVHIEFRRAWSIWPGRVHVDDIRIAFEDKNVQFSIDIPRVDVTVQLRALLRRTFYATRVSGSGLAFRFRTRVDPSHADSPIVRAFPPVDDFDDPALYISAPPKPPTDKAHFHPWTVHIENVDVEVRELWIQMLRYQGLARAKGAFRLVPATRLWVGPASLDFTDGTVVTGPYDVVRNLEGAIGCTVHEFDVNAVHGADVFRFFSTTTSLAASLPRLEALSFLSPGLAPLAIEDGSGLLDADVVFERGSFAPDSRIVYRTDHIGMTVQGAPFRVDGEVALMGLASTGPDAGHLELRIPDALLALPRAQYEPIRLRDVDTIVSTATVDITRHWSFAGGRARGALTLPDLRALRDLPIPRARAMGIEDGRAEVLATATLSSEKNFAADVEARVDGAQGTWGPLRWRGAAAIDVTARGRTGRSARIDGRVAARHLTTCNHEGRCSIAPTADASGQIWVTPHRPIVGRFHVWAGDFALEIGKTTVAAALLEGNAELSPEGLSAAVLLTDLGAGAPAGSPWIRARTAAVSGRFSRSAGSPTANSLQGILVGTTFNWGNFTLRSADTRVQCAWNGQQVAAQALTGTLRMQADGGPPEGWHADVQGATVRTNLRRGGDKLQGPLHLELGRLVGRVGRTGIQGDLSADFSLGSGGPSHPTTDFSGIARLRNVALQARRGEVHDWWADLGVRVGHINAHENLNVTGRLQAHFRDALPVLRVLASQERIPRWVPSIFPLRDVHLDLALERYCHRTDVQALAASGGPFEARARLLVGLAGKVRGALYVRPRALPFLSVGVNFVQDSRQTSLFAGSRWFDRQMVPLDELVRRRRAIPCEDGQ